MRPTTPGFRRRADDGVAEADHEGLVADELCRQANRVGVAGGTALARVEELDPCRLVVHLPDSALSGSQVGGELGVVVEVVLDGALLAAGDEQELAQALLDHLFHHVLHHGLGAHGQHLLGLGLGRRQKPGAHASHRENSFANRRHLHRMD